MVPQKEKRRNRVAQHGPKFQSFFLVFESARSQLYLKKHTNQPNKQKKKKMSPLTIAPPTESATHIRAG